MKNSIIIDQFLGLVFQGKMDDALLYVHSEGEFLGASVEQQIAQPLSGVFLGAPGARKFFKNFQDTLEPQSFEVTESKEIDDILFRIGTLAHKVRSTNKLFKSHWALYCKIENGKIKKYQFFEDTYALTDSLIISK